MSIILTVMYKVLNSWGIFLYVLDVRFPILYLNLQKNLLTKKHLREKFRHLEI